MNQLVLGAIILFCLWRLFKKERLTNSPVLDKALRSIFSVLALVFSIAALIRGNLAIAAPLLIFAAAQRGWLREAHILLHIAEQILHDPLPACGNASGLHAHGGRG